MPPTTTIRLDPEVHEVGRLHDQAELFGHFPARICHGFALQQMAGDGDVEQPWKDELGRGAPLKQEIFMRMLTAEDPAMDGLVPRAPSMCLSAHGHADVLKVLVIDVERFLLGHHLPQRTFSPTSMVQPLDRARIVCTRGSDSDVGNYIRLPSAEKPT